MAEWVVLELGAKADGEDPDIIRSSIRHLLRDAEVFLPVSVTQQGDDRSVNYLLDGYAFVRRTHPDERYFRLEGSKYVQTVMTHTVLGTKIRRLACVGDADIEKFRSQIRVQEDQGIQVNDLVLITSGPYKNLKAIVIEDIPEQDAVQVHVQLRSKDSLVLLPRAFLRLAEKAPQSAYQVRMTKLRTWVSAVLTLSQWEAPMNLGEVFEHWLLLERTVRISTAIVQFNQTINPDLLREKAALLNRLITWFEEIQKRYQDIVVFGRDLDTTRLVQTHNLFQDMTRWVTNTKHLAASVFSLYASLPTPKLQQTYLSWMWASEAQQRLTGLISDIETIQTQMMSTYRNLVIDGHNLAVRCASAPGLSELKDSKDRPTGAIVGTLNTLAMLTKRFPGVSIFVTWDGSSQRRKELFTGYKEGRGNPKATFEVSWLQRFLPLFGVYQAWNDAEEADDAIATLVRGRFAGQDNLIFSTDRDLLQLVDDTTHVLVPSVGGGKEKLFTIEEVEAQYGVKPHLMPLLRSLSGDTSDSIPGVTNCGLKTAAKLVVQFGSLDALFRSNMAGLAKGLTSNLRASEAQVRLNLQLMSLIDIPISVVDPDVDAAAASKQLQELNIKPDRFLSSFFGGPAAA